MIKKLIFVFCLFFLAIPMQIWALPSSTGYITDEAHILPTKAKMFLAQVSQVLDQKGQIQLATVVVDSLGNEDIDVYANKLYEKWGIGSKTTDKGVLFVTSLKEKKVRIEVGYGLEGVLPDGKTGALLDKYVLPYYKAGKMAEGIINGHLAIAQLIADEFQIPLKAALNQADGNRNVQTMNPLARLISTIFFFIIIFWLLKTGKGGWLIFILLMLSGGRGGGGSFGGFGGSGFGGFGGGLSGGGGSSRGW
jgi:uncharacterized protein